MAVFLNMSRIPKVGEKFLLSSLCNVLEAKIPRFPRKQLLTRIQELALLRFMKDQGRKKITFIKTKTRQGTSLQAQHHTGATPDPPRAQHGRTREEDLCLRVSRPPNSYPVVTSTLSSDTEAIVHLLNPTSPRLKLGKLSSLRGLCRLVTWNSAAAWVCSWPWASRALTTKVHHGPGPPATQQSLSISSRDIPLHFCWFGECCFSAYFRLFYSDALLT
ncbi:uncharacterized protein LOC102155713 isoform X1 [Canis lupus familiaris]|uniref:uncharacterized protein LOC102155713 isoform X1 n=1 Tax=Canis lupus familiaris TaxID=9615 RepID=UPI0006B3C5BC|nr:uncharacterized protein LOC102155713 isoform X1 [Canis lupus familiaris]XP_038302675.1 uncharacterized protein LOC102155713 isoform X1 [Canis lupus familiaris]XP_038302676.1 uncharacterized protein LOC102155713 isoform X1 [Canis lupus familiaris]XP_038319331.1 uncharacterized protein LOC102155713 isoform X1 [Canis lupus familiaris]|eukprot:XP_013966160.1 uncharacterized protein LOC102155713 isoform X1 [Canis lupus familiaris]